MSFPTRFVTIAICLTFIACAVLRNVTPLVGKVMDLHILQTLQEIQHGKPLGANKFTL